MILKTKIKLSMLVLVFQIFLSQSVEAIDITSNTTISTNTTYDSVVIKNWATLTLNAELLVTWDMTIESGWILTHSLVTSTDFNLLVDWILDIQSWWKIDMTWKWKSSTWGWDSQRYWWTYWWKWRHTYKEVYWDIYNPLEVWSYWRWGWYRWWWLVRMTVWWLINNGSILTNWTNWSRWRWSWWAINIMVNGNLSWAWIYEANWWECTNNSVWDWWWWRIAIKYWSISDLSILRNNISVKWPATAWEWTIYLKNNTNWDEYLIIKWDGWSRWTTISNVDISSLEELEVNGARVTIWAMSWTISSDILNLDNGFYLSISSSDLIFDWDLSLWWWTLSIWWYFDVNWNLSTNGTAVTSTTNCDISWDISLVWWSLTCPVLTWDWIFNADWTTVNSTTSITHPWLMSLTGWTLTTLTLSNSGWLSQDWWTISVIDWLFWLNVNQTSWTINSTNLLVDWYLESWWTVNGAKLIDIKIVLEQ